MPTLQVRNLPDSLYNKIADQADASHRSITQQVIISLSEGLSAPLNNKERRKNLLATIQKNKHDKTLQQLADPTPLIQEDRSR